MSSVASNTLSRTPFHEFHVDNGARMVEFAGWEMPMLYRSIIEEHCQVRTSGGFFDVSHMGRLRFTGPDACRFLDRVCTRQIHGMADDQCRYSIVCNEHGGCRDDVLVYRFGPDEYLMVCNAANRTKLLEHFDAVRGDLDAEWRDETARTAMIAVQGPKVMDLIGDVAPDVASLKRFRFVRKSIMGADVLISRTGYTGEDGVEVIMPATMAVQSVSLLMSTIGGADSPVKPAGLGARDTLRMESAMALYGHEITEQIDPLSAGLTFAVKLDKGDDGPEEGAFIGQEALKKIAETGPDRSLAGLVLEGRRTPRQGMIVNADGAEIGVVTSGCLSPTLGRPIAMAYLDSARREPGSAVEVLLGAKKVTAEVVGLPFYKR
ncbi:MAG: glycine cleavage system aminomethyltransferase GcvT [Planctomycetes bacterium]|nr:glycine cleavage system aminomethyltransferase GcvT [Planctomycetota bacterium]